MMFLGARMAFMAAAPSTLPIELQVTPAVSPRPRAPRPRPTTAKAVEPVLDLPKSRQVRRAEARRLAKRTGR